MPIPAMNRVAKKKPTARVELPQVSAVSAFPAR
jgi:hypothetical protein